MKFGHFRRNFGQTSPRLTTADPLSPAVREWWAHKIAMLSGKCPGFRGFLIKADSEGQGGPAGYNRTEADGANMFGDLLQPIGGLCIWRAFGHPGDTDDAKDWGEDQAMYQFKLWAPVDGKLHPNVALQIKNGALQRAAS